MATTLKRKGAAKEPSIEKLAKQQARGHEANGNGAAGKLNPTLREELNKSLRERAGRLHRLASPDLDEADAQFLYRVEHNVQLDPPDVVRLQVLLERHAKLLNGEAVPGNGKAGVLVARAGASDHKHQPPAPAPADAIVRLPLRDLVRHPDNRRPTQDSIDQRAESMQREGQHEPIVVRKLFGGQYQVLSGETRWCAAAKLKWKDIAARVVELDEIAALKYLAEANGQRADLTPIDKAKLIERLCAPATSGGAGLTREQAAKHVGLNDGASASNLVRLLKLPKIWQDRVASGKLDQSWARLLIPLLPLTPVMEHFDEEFRTRNHHNTPWHERAFDSRRNLEREIEYAVANHVRRIGAPTYKSDYSSAKFTPKIDLANPHVAKQLEVVEVEMPTGKKGQVEKVAFALNTKAYDELVEKQKTRKAKAAAERAGRDKPAKKEMTAAERKALDAKQAKQLRERIDAWRHKLLRRACIQAIDAGQDSGLRIVLAFAADRYVPNSSVTFHKALEEVRGIKARNRNYASWDYWPCVAGIASGLVGTTGDDEDGVIAKLAQRILGDESKDWRRPTLPHSLVESYAASIGVKLEQAWFELRAGPGGRDLLEELFLTLGTHGLRTYAGEVGLKPAEGATRKAMCQTLVSRIGFGQSLPLPKCIRPLPTAKGATKGTKSTKKGKR